MSRKIILIKQELLLLVYELNRRGMLAENEKIRPILAKLEKFLLCDLSPFFFSSRRRHTRCGRDWSSDVCSSDLWLTFNRAPARAMPPASAMPTKVRSEERRVGKECKTSTSPCEDKEALTLRPFAIN